MKKDKASQVKISRDNPKTDKTDITISDQFPIVGIGASAGGLEALEGFFINVPENSGMAFIVIQHLSPDHKGILGELLQRVTKMQVYTVTDRMKVSPNCVYVIPSNKSMSILNGELHLFKLVEVHGPRLPIDFFFRSLAIDQKEKSIGIILSGMGSDGSLGLKAIKEQSGLVMVQDPESAKFDSMPRSAIDSVVVDIVASVNELPESLIKLIQHSPKSLIKEELEKDSSSLDKVIILLRNHTGNDFSQYKKNTMYRRIERRMGVHQLNKIAAYVRYLQENPTEADILFKELLIGVTNFFRDNVVWDYLKDNVFPDLFAGVADRYTIRAWIPGCSSGEEAFSLAIVFKEALEKSNLKKSISFQIFATDLDISAIDKARKGIYPENIINDVSPERIKRFFTKTNDQYRVNTEIREMVVFASQNVIKDPPFTKLDILSCRNLLIYIEPDLQKKILSLFHYSLIPGGILLLGSAETRGTHGDLFSVINSKLRIYRRSGLAQKDEFFNFSSSLLSNKAGTSESQLLGNIPNNIQTFTDQLLLQQFSPASALTTDKGDILYLTGNIGKYLTPAAGKANMNLFAMAREGLRNDLSIAFRKSLQNYEKTILHNVKIETEGGNRFIDVTIQQIIKPLVLKNKILVIFSDVEASKTLSSKQSKEKIKDYGLGAHLEIELKTIKEELETTREEMQTSQEELKSTNEELQSNNEELQSANEELTTSKEEMQSLNEELQTVNAELQSKIDDSVRINNDLNNLLNSSEIATLFLDKEFNIRQFTISATKIFKLRKVDIGRPFTELVTDLIYPEIYHDSMTVLLSEDFIEKEISTTDKHWYNIRITPYKTFENKMDGLVITFIDITKSKYLEEKLKNSQMMFQSFIEFLSEGIISLSTDGTVTAFNQAAEKIIGMERNQVLGNNYYNLFIPASMRNKIETDMQKLLGGLLSNKYKSYIKTINNEELQIEWATHKHLDDQTTLIGIIENSFNK